MRTYAASHARTALLLTAFLALAACDAPIPIGGGGGSGGGDGGSGGSGATTGAGGNGTGGATTGTGMGGSGGGIPCGQDSVDQALTDFIGCMSFTDWVDTGMPEIGNTTTLNGNTCYSCHTSGVGLFQWSNPSTPAAALETFEWYTQLQFIHYLVSATMDSSTCAVTLAPSEEIQEKGMNGAPHPAYDFTAGQVTLTSFFDITHDKMLNGTCP